MKPQNQLKRQEQLAHLREKETKEVEVLTGRIDQTQDSLFKIIKIGS